MYAPSPAIQVWPASRHFAGVCQCVGSFNPSNGLFVPYRRVPGYSDAYEAVINLFVIDLSSPFADYLPFVIDTATDVTIIPRKLLSRSNTFPPSRAIGPYSVKGLTGKTVIGLRFRAAVAIAPRRPGPTPLGFGKLKPIVVDDWKENYGMLGLDALRRVVMVSDSDHVCFWPLPLTL